MEVRRQRKNTQMYRLHNGRMGLICFMGLLQQQGLIIQLGLVDQLGLLEQLALLEQVGLIEQLDSKNPLFGVYAGV